MGKQADIPAAVESRYIAGIDLGTTNTALAYVDLREPTEQRRIKILDIPQVVRPGAVESRPLLPSFIYLPAENELPAGSLALPWDENRSYAVGEFARNRGKEVPGRLISSAKSWLCQAGVDRRAALLPSGAAADVQKVSPVEAATLLLRHLGEAWDANVAKGQKGCSLAEQQVLLCVPASFDAAARELTLDAAKAAGLQNVTLVEEPQAAFYAWLEATYGKWRERVKVGDLILVVDIGGGTTDFTLIAVGEKHGALTLQRLAVGDHILLGGDNMDLTLAHAVTAKLASQGIELDEWQLRSLAHSCRDAKESLLAPSNTNATTRKAEHPSSLLAAVRKSAASVPKAKKTKRREAAVPLFETLKEDERELPLAILGRGCHVVEKSIRVKITRGEVMDAILEGFFPSCEPTDRPARAVRTGLQELGLAYASDPSVSRHLARFLAKENLGAGKGLAALPGTVVVHPTAILFNGGVMKAPALCNRMVQILSDWLAEENAERVRVLASADPDLAVARGAVYFGLAVGGQGVRIRGGAARSYYIGVEASTPAVPGRKPPTKAMCVVPFGMEEGSEAEVPGAEFGLVVGESAQFRLFSSTTRRHDRLGSKVQDRGDGLVELAPVEASLPATRRTRAGTVVPVRLRSKITTVGTVELWCYERSGPGKWKLELNTKE